MGRILLGVSGGIAAYKALEVVRLATKAGHAVRVVQTPSSLRFVGAASFAGLSGATGPHRRVRARPRARRLPDQAPPEHDPLSHLELVRNADVLLVAPASANTIAKLAYGLADNPAHERGAGRDLPGRRRAGDEQPHVRAPGHAGQPGLAARARRHGARARRRRAGSKGEWGVGRLPSRPTCSRRSRPRWRRGRSRLVGLRSSSPPAARASRSTRCGSSATARPGAWASRWPRRPRPGRRRHRGRRQRRAAPPPGIRYVDVSTAAELQAACEAEFAAADVLLMAAAVADFRPAAASRGRSRRTAGPSSSCARATDDVLAALAGRRRPGQTLVGFAAEHGDDAVALGRGKLERKGLDAVVVNDIARADIGFEGPQNEVTIVTARDERHVERASKAEVARAVLDVVGELRATAEHQAGAS
jgi:phosphopantothenoylcysteine decarboxylase/phosphopantothenate--cysteine ligase